MNRPLVLSGGVAFSLHALFLFGISSLVHPPKVKETVSTSPVIEVERFLLKEDPPEVPAETTGSAGPPVPTSIDLPDVVRPEAFQVPIVRSQLTSVRPNIDRIPTTFTSELGVVPGDANASNGPTVIGSHFLDGPPVARSQTPPAYPFEMRRNGTTGQVVVAFNVDESGRAFGPKIVSSTAREFEEPTLRAVERWRFQPGIKNGKKVRFSMVVPVMFNVTGD